jgi:hypothetical protein
LDATWKNGLAVRLWIGTPGKSFILRFICSCWCLPKSIHPNQEDSLIQGCWHTAEDQLTEKIERHTKLYLLAQHFYMIVMGLYADSWLIDASVKIPFKKHRFVPRLASIA